MPRKVGSPTRPIKDNLGPLGPFLRPFNLGSFGVHAKGRQILGPAAIAAWGQAHRADRHRCCAVEAPDPGPPSLRLPRPKKKPGPCVKHLGANLGC